MNKKQTANKTKQIALATAAAKEEEEEEAAKGDKKEKERNKKYMFVCMFYLSPRSRIIVSIWETSETTLSKRRRKEERKRMNKKQKFSLFVTNQLRILYSLTFLRTFLLLFV